MPLSVSTAIPLSDSVGIALSISTGILRGASIVGILILREMS